MRLLGPYEAEVARSDAAGRDHSHLKLFAMERKWADLTPFQREVMCQMKAEPLLDAYWAWMEKPVPAAGSRLEDAVTYAETKRNM